MDTYEWNNELLIQTNQGGVVEQGKLIDVMRVEASVLLSSRQPSHGTADEKHVEFEWIKVKEFHLLRSELIGQQWRLNLQYKLFLWGGDSDV